MNGKVALVTGASGGIGKAFALALGREGFAVAINYLTNEHSAKDIAREINHSGGDAMIVRGDVTSEDQVQTMINAVIGEYGRLDVLVNNAGIYKDSTVWKMTRETWCNVLDVNLTGAFLCTRASIPHLRKNGWGRIVNISSVVGEVGMFGTSNYAASKAGLFALTKTVAKEVARFGITVNCLALGYFDAGMFLMLQESTRNRIIEGIPLGRPGTMTEVVAPLLFLVSEGSGYITGQVIHVNGGCYG
jgi:NAD(P)-dependent dehydrogenase (short-subunit alcohol dehydrogenase family)